MILALIAVIAYSASSILILRGIPDPHAAADYLVTGAVATFVTLGVLFVVAITAYLRDPDTFFKRRPKK